LAERGVKLRAPRGGGSHYTVQYPRGILTIPARRPVKPVYVRKFTEVIENLIGEGGEHEKG
jgi:hypothetical protein